MQQLAPFVEMEIVLTPKDAVTLKLMYREKGVTDTLSLRNRGPTCVSPMDILTSSFKTECTCSDVKDPSVDFLCMC